MKTRQERLIHKILVTNARVRQTEPPPPLIEAAFATMLDSSFLDGVGVQAEIPAVAAEARRMSDVLEKMSKAFEKQTGG